MPVHLLGTYIISSPTSDFTRKQIKIQKTSWYFYLEDTLVSCSNSRQSNSSPLQVETVPCAETAQECLLGALWDARLLLSQRKLPGQIPGSPPLSMCLYVKSKQMQESHPALAHAVCAQSLSSNLVAAGAFLGICTF